MTTLEFEGQNFEVLPDETVLDCLQRNEQSIASSCKSGICQACLIQTNSKDIDPKAQAGLKPTMQAQGFALACQWKPQTDVAVRVPGLAENSEEFTITSMQLLNQTVMQLMLEKTASDSQFSCKPGQYITLTNPEGISRSYSVANDPEVEGKVECHIANTLHGKFTTWLFNQAKPGDRLHVRGPAGTCYYAPASQDAPLILAGTGTGLAPLLGIARDALRQQHVGNITLLHGSIAANNLYCQNTLSALAEAHNNFRYIPLVRDSSDDTSVQQGDISAWALEQLDQQALAQTQVYLCGNPELVHSLRKSMFLKGVRSSNILCDPFIESPRA